MSLTRAPHTLQIISSAYNLLAMWRRLASARLASLVETFPAVLILGARQVGKTTLARATFRSFPYVDLEEPRMRALFQDDPSFQITSRATPSLILDEAQTVPEVFSALRGIIDKRRRTSGRFILLGSAQPSLVRGVSESLAGRVGILDLDPLCAIEVARGRERRSWSDLWLRGGFPDALRVGAFRDWWEAYLRAYIERDLPALGVGADPILVRRLMTMLAHQQGGILNASQLGASLGVSYNTVILVAPTPVPSAPVPELEIEFDTPITWSGKEYTSIFLREPKSVQLENALAAGGADQNRGTAQIKEMKHLIGAVADVPRQVVEQMPLRKFRAAASYLESFLG